MILLPGSGEVARGVARGVARRLGRALGTEVRRVEHREMSGLGKLMFRTSRFLTEQAMTGHTLAQRRREVRLAATSDVLPPVVKAEFDCPARVRMSPASSVVRACPSRFEARGLLTIG